MGQRMRVNTYKDITTKVVALIAVFGMVIASGVAIYMRVIETQPVYYTEKIWFKVESFGNTTSIQAAIYIYDDNNTFLETFLFLNDTGWQSTIEEYEYGKYLNIFIDFWFIDEIVDFILYRVGNSPIIVTYEKFSISIISNMEAPNI